MSSVMVFVGDSEQKAVECMERVRATVTRTRERVLTCGKPFAFGLDPVFQSVEQEFLAATNGYWILDDVGFFTVHY